MNKNQFKKILNWLSFIFRYNIEKKYLWNRISYRGVLWVEDIEEESQVSFKKL